MPNTPNQFPNIDLPGAEYFSIQPNGSIAIQGRRRIVIDSGTASIPPSAAFFLPFARVIETNFLTTSGIYVHRAQLSAFPAGVADKVTATTILFGFTLVSGQTFPDYSLGFPTATSTSFPVGQTLVIERDLLVTARDITFDKFANSGNLVLCGGMQLNNSNATSSPNFVVDAKIIYTRLDGFTE